MWTRLGRRAADLGGVPVDVMRRSAFGILVVAVAVVAPLRSQTRGALPDTPPGRRLAELIAIVNSGDYRTVRAYAESSFSEEFVGQGIDERVDALMRLKAASQELSVAGVLSSSSERVVAEVANRLADMNQALGVSVERSAPHRISMWYRGPVADRGEPPGTAPPPEGEVVAAMSAFLDRLAAADAFSGTVLVGRGDSILMLRAFGHARRHPDAANRTDTRFNIASVGKLFTAVAIAQLAERGRLSFQDPVARHLGPDWLAPDLASQIRIEHLLTHRSGLGDYLESDAMLRATAPARALEDYRPIIRAERPQWRPGTRYGYSNSGFIVLGAIVERVSGRPFAGYLQERILGPAGMAGPSDWPRDLAAPPAPDFATGYTSRFSAAGIGWSENTRRIAAVAPSPAGGQYASAEELWRFARALTTGVLLQDSTWSVMAAPAPVRGGPPSGYGFEIGGRGEERIVGHGGSHEGIGAVLDIYLRSGYTLVALSNADRSAFAVREKFRSVVLNPR